MKPSKQLHPGSILTEGIVRIVRGERVIIDTDLAAVYGVPAKHLRATVMRNLDRFQTGTLFRLTAEEASEVASLPWPSRPSSGGKYAPIAFTAHGVIMAASILRSAHAAKMNQFIARAFLYMLQTLSSDQEQVEVLHELEGNSEDQPDVRESSMVTIFQQFNITIEPTRLPSSVRKDINELTLYRKLATFYHHRWRMR